MSPLNESEYPRYKRVASDSKGLKLASRRSYLNKNTKFVRLLMPLIIFSFLISLFILSVLPNEEWLVPLVIVATFILGVYLSSISSKKHLEDLDDVD